MGTNSGLVQGTDPAGALDAALILTDGWRVPIDVAHDILRANGRTDPEAAMRAYIEDGGWYTEEDGHYAATRKAREYIVAMFLAGRAASRLA